MGTRWVEPHVGLWAPPGERRPCWWLVRKVLRAHGLDVAESGPVEPEFAASAARARRGKAPRSPWSPVPAGEERALDVVAMRGEPFHVGVVADRDWMLHLEDGRTSELIRMTDPLVSERIIGVYRLVADAHAVDPAVEVVAGRPLPSRH